MSLNVIVFIITFKRITKIKKTSFVRYLMKKILNLNIVDFFSLMRLKLIFKT